MSRLHPAKTCGTAAVAAMLILSAMSLTKVEAAQAVHGPPAPARALFSHKSGCDQTTADYRQSGTFTFPTDCDVEGSVEVPAFTESGSSGAYGIGDHLCMGPNVLQPKHRCYEQTGPSGQCTEAANTLWYFELTFTARTSHGYGSQNVQFDLNAFPFTFASPSLILSGKRYGFCVVAGGTVMQDDFASGKGVAPKGDTISLPMTVTKQFIAFYHKESFDIFLESN